MWAEEQVCKAEYTVCLQEPLFSMMPCIQLVFTDFFLKLSGSLGALGDISCRQEMDWVLNPQSLYTVVAVSFVWCWSTFQNTPPSLLHWGLPYWSSGPFVLSGLKSLSLHVSLGAYFHFSEISSKVTCSRWPLELPGSTLLSASHWLC